jgi:hypothetical protein
MVPSKGSRKHNRLRDDLKILFLGLVAGVVVTVGARYVVKHTPKKLKLPHWQGLQFSFAKQIKENFTEPLDITDGQAFGRKGQLTFELFRNGTFIGDGQSDYATQKSESYRDSAIIRSTHPLPKTYKISAVVGGINYGLEKISGLLQDDEYPEGPQNENGCYLLVIADELPDKPHTNIWWHQHRKVIIDVDNNVWGHGMPNPIFMVYFDQENQLNAFNDGIQEWQKEWTQAASYDPQAWYKVEIEKTKSHYRLRLFTEDGKLLQSASVRRSQVWHGDDDSPDYLVIGDPHENYYQGSMKIKSIEIPAGR